MLELLLRIKGMLDEVRDAGVPETETFVLTGGVSQSPLFQHVFRAGIERLAPGKAVRVSGRKGPLRYKTSAYGALINAELPRFHGRLAELHSSGDRFPLVDCAAADAGAASPTPLLARIVRSVIASLGLVSGRR